MDQNSRQTTEVRQTDNQTGDTDVRRENVTTTNTVSTPTLARRIVYYIGGAIISLLALRFILQLLGANEGNAFVDFVYGLSAFFVAPFFGVFGAEPTYGASQFEISTLVAMIVYALLTIGIGKLFTINRPHEETA